MDRRRLQPPLIVALYAITSICGLLDAACFLGLGRVFSEIMTGNLVYLAFSLGTIGTHGTGPILPYVSVLAFFMVGAVGGGRFLRLPAPFSDRRAGFAVEWAALLAATVTTAILHPGPEGGARFVVTGILSFAMGIQNAMLRRWGVANLATNVMTLTMTALVADSRLAGGPRTHARRRAASLAIFAASATLGAFLLRYGVLWPLVLSLVIFSLALPVLLQKSEADGRAVNP
jgi:uncharacterized membrane protein YoaK (UPF0700 family)